MAKNNLLDSLESNAKPPRGRGSEIKNGRLQGVRDHLVWLLETTWADVGGRLSSIKAPADVCTVLQVWRERSREHIVQTLLRPSSKHATSKSLNELRRRIRDLNVKRMEAWQYREECRESLEVAKRALNPQLSEGERIVVEEQITLRAKKFTQAEEELTAATRRQADTEQSLQDGEAYFARREFVDFCRSHRYRLTPVHTANALAGLPFMGWRQSVKRCRPHEPVGANGGAIQIFEAIRRIVRSCSRKSELIKHAERWLKHPVGISSKSYGVSELRQKWFYLRWSIKTALEAGTRTRELPYAIAREYDHRKNHPSNVDLLFEEEERIQ